MSKIKASNIKEISYNYEAGEITIKLKKHQVLHGYSRAEVVFSGDYEMFKKYVNKSFIDQKGV